MPGIKTFYKDPIGSHLAYPMTLGVISSAIAPASDFLNISVRFFSYKAAKPGEIRDRFEICEVRFDPSSPDDREIYVRPVPCEIQKRIHDRVGGMLKETLAPWLLAKRIAGWHERKHAITIWFSSMADSFEIGEDNRA